MFDICRKIMYDIFMVKYCWIQIYLFIGQDRSMVTFNHEQSLRYFRGLWSLTFTLSFFCSSYTRGVESKDCSRMMIEDRSNLLVIYLGQIFEGNRDQGLVERIKTSESLLERQVITIRDRRSRIYLSNLQVAIKPSAEG